ncbi:hypothetical protein Mpsy_2985 [Methanolobus psychrophilus R15]|nr:hypothetical protein Mpsy_2985 [Methanolobus psychrophilus R15]
MKQLNKCPECKARLRDLYHNIQHCATCGYRTHKGTAKLDSLMVFHRGGNIPKRGKKICSKCKKAFREILLGTDIIYQ